MTDTGEIKGVLVEYDEHQDTPILKKLTAAIHYAGNLTLVQQKLANAMLLNAYEELLTHDRHRIPVGEMSELIGYDSKSTAELKKALRVLNETVVEWDILNDDGQEEFGTVPIVAGAKVVNGIIEYSYSPFLKEKLYEPATFGRLNLFIQRQFRSKYSLRLYENLNAFYTQGKRTTGKLPVPIVRKLLSVQDGEYSEFRYFRRKVIQVAVNEINARTDLFVEPEFIRARTRRVVAIEFHISPNANGSPVPGIHEVDENFTLEHALSEPLVARLRSRIGLPENQCLDLISQHGEAYLEALMRYVLQKQEKNEVGRNIRAYFYGCIKKGFQPEDLVVEKTKPERVSKTDQSVDELAREANEKLLRNAFNQEKQRVIGKRIAEMDQHKREVIHDEFIASLPVGHRPLVKLFRKEGLKDPRVKSLYYDFMYRYFDPEFDFEKEFGEFKRRHSGAFASPHRKKIDNSPGDLN